MIQAQPLTACRTFERALSCLHRYPSMIQAFRAIDFDNSGTLTRDEVKAMFKTLRIMVREPTLETLLDIVDIDEGGDLDYKEFAQVLTTDSSGLEAMIAGES
jgi:Ca2+-binding EF-hand superfamily protein